MKHFIPLLFFVFLLLISGKIPANTTDSNPSVVNTANGNSSSGLMKYLLDSGNDDSLNLQELLEELSPTVTPVDNTYFKVEACEGANSTTLLVEVNVNREGLLTHPGYLYFFPNLDQHFVIEVIGEGRLRSGEKRLEFWNNGPHRITITDNQVIQSGSSRTRALNAPDVLSCLGDTLGVNLNFTNLTTGFFSLTCTSLKLYVLYQTGLHCFSMAGIGVNNVTSTLGCIGGIARYVSCGYVNCAGLAQKIANVNTSGGGHPNRANGTRSFCTTDFPCLAGQGDCDYNGHCQSGLYCQNARGANYGLDPSTDVCEAPTPTSSVSPGTSCGSNQIYDCVGTCVNASTASNWTGDGYCDNGKYGSNGIYYNLVCSAFSHDGGDCN